MASITIRNLDDSTKKNLRRRAAENGRSLEAEVRAILNHNAHTSPSSPPKTGLDLFRGIREVVEKYGGVELEIPPRTPLRPLHLSDDAREFRDVMPEKARRKRRK